MNQPTPLQALQNLKAGLDLAVKKGAFENLEQTATLLTSLQIIANDINRGSSNSNADNNSPS